MGKAGIAVVEHADMPGPRDALEHRRKAVHRDQGRRQAGMSPSLQFARNRVVIGPKNLANASLYLGFAEADISRYDGALADFDDRRLRTGHAVAVDGEAGVILPYDHRAELVSHQAAHRAHPDVKGDMTLEFGLPEAEALQAARQIVPGVIGRDDECRPAGRVGHRDRLRLIRCEKPRRHVMHGGSLVAAWISA